MALTEIIRFGGESSLDKHSPSTSADDTILDTVKAFRGVDGPKHFIVGTLIQDKNAVQVTSEWDDVEDHAKFESPLVGNVRKSYGEPKGVYHVAFKPSAFGPSGPGEANVIEFAQNYFPVSRVTPEFQTKVEADFLRFDEICRRGMKGNAGLAYGWVLEKQTHDDIKDEDAWGFLIMRGWESMGDFEEFVKTDTFGEAIQILLAWNVPYEMWHVERKVLESLT